MKLLVYCGFTYEVPIIVCMVFEGGMFVLVGAELFFPLVLKCTTTKFLEQQTSDLSMCPFAVTYL